MHLILWLVSVVTQQELKTKYNVCKFHTDVLYWQRRLSSQWVEMRQRTQIEMVVK